MGRLKPFLIVGLAVLAVGCGALRHSQSSPPVALAGPVFDGNGSLNASGWTFFRAALSPDGKKAAFKGENPHGQWVIGLAKAGAPTVLTTADVVPSDFAWLPDSGSLLISYRTTDSALHKPVGVADRLAILDLTGHLRNLPTDRAFVNENDQGMTVSSDGHTAVLAVRDVGADGQPSRLLSVDLRSGRTAPVADYSPESADMPVFVDSTHLLFVRATLNSADPNGQLYELDLGTHAATRLTSADQVVSSADVLGDGKTVVYEAFSPTDRSSRALWFLQLKGGRPRRVKAVDATYPSLYRSGGWVLVTNVGTPGASGELQLLSLPLG